jgi:hypothetical protein
MCCAREPESFLNCDCVSAGLRFRYYRRPTTPRYISCSMLRPLPESKRRLAIQRLDVCLSPLPAHSQFVAADIQRCFFLKDARERYNYNLAQELSWSIR